MIPRGRPVVGSGDRAHETVVHVAAVSEIARGNKLKERAAVLLRAFIETEKIAGRQAGEQRFGLLARPEQFSAGLVGYFDGHAVLPRNLVEQRFKIGVVDVVRDAPGGGLDALHLDGLIESLQENRLGRAIKSGSERLRRPAR